ncbi:hypothetical protein BBL07_15890 [Agrobacterium vitis]|nr:hypothetical protein BBL07_15890 [Agrobacterium vitis]
MRIESSSGRGGNTPSIVAVPFPPKATIKCVGSPAFRTRGARDLACLLDVDPDVEKWQCLPSELRCGEAAHVPDFLVTYVTGRRSILDAAENGEAWIGNAADEAGYSHEFIPRRQRESGWRLRNARDLLRYGNHVCPLGDRIRVLATLDEVGSFSFAEGLTLFREIPPVAGLATLVLQTILSVDLDEALIGPDTIVRRGNGEIGR